MIHFCRALIGQAVRPSARAPPDWLRRAPTPPLYLPSPTHTTPDAAHPTPPPHVAPPNLPSRFHSKSAKIPFPPSFPKINPQPSKFRSDGKQRPKMASYHIFSDDFSQIEKFSLSYNLHAHVTLTPYHGHSPYTDLTPITPFLTCVGLIGTLSRFKRGLIKTFPAILPTKPMC